ncbi:DNA replication complex GINS protein PSF3 [Hetaerina americana]|uniref:DNA replication complex GINS protein PSF3 n=1 Tax=Hetaerina americana TaxID=62018 RepID=UPI003A7F5BD2
MPLFRSYYPHYFSIDDIMATQERLPCKFEIDVRRLGFLDPSSDSEDIASGTTLELPYWLARSLCNRSQSVISVNIPRIYKEAYREILKADASVVDLHRLSVYFYEFGSYLSGFNHRDSAEIGSLLLQTFKDRFRLIMDWSQNSSGDMSQRSTGELGLDPTSRLDSLERGLLHSGRASWMALESWLAQGGGRPIGPANMVVNHQKRQQAHASNS